MKTQVVGEWAAQLFSGVWLFRLIGCINLSVFALIAQAVISRSWAVDVLHSQLCSWRAIGTPISWEQDRQLLNLVVSYIAVARFHEFKHIFGCRVPSGSDTEGMVYISGGVEHQRHEMLMDTLDNPRLCCHCGEQHFFSRVLCWNFACVPPEPFFGRPAAFYLFRAVKTLRRPSLKLCEKGLVAIAWSAAAVQLILCVVLCPN